LSGPAGRPPGERLLWFAAIWIASVGALALVALAIRWVLSPAG
jgi:hypothetical protein